MSIVRDLRLASDVLPDSTRRDRADLVKEARRLRAAEFERLFRVAGSGFARAGRP